MSAPDDSNITRPPAAIYRLSLEYTLDNETETHVVTAESTGDIDGSSVTTHDRPHDHKSGAPVPPRYAFEQAGHVFGRRCRR